MTPREQLAKQRRPYLRTALIGAVLFASGLLLIRLQGQPPLVSPDGVGSAAGYASLALVLLGGATSLVSASLLSLRGDCPRCGKSMGPAGWHRRLFCPLCGLRLDEEDAGAGAIPAGVLKTQRKEWLLQSFAMLLLLSTFTLLAFAQILFLRSLLLEMDRKANAAILGRYYAQACTTQKGEDAFRKLCLSRLKVAQASSCWEKLCLPSDEEAYRKAVLAAFEKELARRKSASMK